MWPPSEATLGVAGEYPRSAASMFERSCTEPIALFTGWIPPDWSY